MTDISKVTPQQYEQYCLNFHLLPCVLPAEIIERYRACCKILEIEPGSSSEAIRNAYKRLSKVRHPDKQGGSTQAMVELVQAKEMLSGYIDLSDGKCDQPFISLKVRPATSIRANLDGDLRSFSPQRMMTLRVVTVLARQHISIAKFTGNDFFVAQLQTIDEALKKILERMRELLAFPFQFSDRFSREDLNNGIDTLLNHYETANSVGKLITHRAIASLFMFFSAVKQMNAYFEEIISDHKMLQMLDLLVKKDALLITQNKIKVDAPGLSFFPPPSGEDKLDEQKPLLRPPEQPNHRETESWWHNLFCCK